MKRLGRLPIHKNKESVPLSLGPVWGKQVRTVYFFLHSVLLTPPSASRVYFIFKASQSPGCPKDKGWKTEATMPSVQARLASLHNHRSEWKLVLGFSQGGMHGVSSSPCSFKNSLHFCDSPRMFSHWDQLTISQARTPLFPTKCLHSYSFFWSWKREYH